MEENLLLNKYIPAPFWAMNPLTWQLGRDSVYTALMCALAGTDITIGLGMLNASTLLVPEQIIFDDEIYHTPRTGTRIGY